MMISTCVHVSAVIIAVMFVILIALGLRKRHPQTVWYAKFHVFFLVIITNTIVMLQRFPLNTEPYHATCLQC